MYLVNYETKRPIKSDSINFFSIDGFVECLRGNRALLLLLMLEDVGANCSFRLRKSLKAKYAKIIGISEFSIYRLYREFVKCGIIICNDDKECFLNPLIAFNGDEFKRIDAIKHILGINVRYFKYRFDYENYLRND